MTNEATEGIKGMGTDANRSGAHSVAEVTVLVVSYNTRDLTLEALRSLYAQTSKTSFEVVVVDNNSQDGSAAAIAAEFPQATLIASTENYGFAGGNNVAAQGANTQYLLLLNPDTVVLDGAVDELMEFARATPQARIWGGRTLGGDRQLAKLSCFADMSVWNQFCRTTGLAAVMPNSSLFNDEHYGGWQRDSVREVDVVSGCFFLIETSLWQELGGFNEKYFMYGEEADLCARARQRGARPIITPAATIVHYGGASEKVRADKMVRLLAAKNELIKEHWPTWKQPLGLALMFGWAVTRTVANAAIVPVKPARGDHFKQWRNVLSRHREWRNGFQQD